MYVLAPTEFRDVDVALDRVVSYIAAHEIEQNALVSTSWILYTRHTYV